MAKSKTTGLIKWGDTWHIDKRVNGVSICESTDTGRIRGSRTVPRGPDHRTPPGKGSPVKPSEEVSRGGYGI